jgi:two-component system alkaline phosphatase synthesis response regulator PhoP
MAKRILIAEDDSNILFSLMFLMNQQHYETLTCGNGVDALTAIREFRPHLVLLDIMLPLKNGFEVCKAVRETPDLAGTKIIMLSAKGRDSEIAKGYALGADAYITKPFATRELTDTVRRLLQDR